MSLLETRGLGKSYGPVVALKSADLTVEAGEIHALLGANGAGKSTFIKMLTGVIRPDRGEISVNGQPVRITSPAAARLQGIAAVFQDPALVPDLTVSQNLCLTGTPTEAVREWWRFMEMEPVDFGDLVSDLPLPTLRMLDLARSLSHDPQLLLLDEITAALPSDLAERVVHVMQHWRERDRAVLFITHRLAEVRAVCDRATVLRDGRDVGTVDPRTSDEETIVQLMLGPVAADVQAAQTEGAPTLGPASEPPPPSGEPMLHVEDLRVGTAVNGMTFDLRPGEVLGVAALEGQGQDALFDALAGRRHADSGEIVVNGRALHLRNPYDAIRAGMVLVPSDRLQALLPQRSVRENIAVPLYNRVFRWGPINTRGESRRVGDAIRRLQIDTRAQRQVRRLSGGNQQKVTIGRWLASGFEVLLLFDPTRGIDVGTKRQIYTLLRELAANGAAILLFTSELPEIQLACDRVIVLYEGQIVSEMPASVADEATLLRAAHGLTEEAASA